MRTVFELFTNEGFTTKEIANMRDTTFAEVENVLAKARKKLRNSFEKRFLLGSN